MGIGDLVAKGCFSISYRFTEASGSLLLSFCCFPALENRIQLFGKVLGSNLAFWSCLLCVLLDLRRRRSSFTFVWFS